MAPSGGRHIEGVSGRQAQPCGVTPRANVSYLAVDFTAEPPIERLPHAPFDRTRPILVSWLGLTQYLAFAAVDEVLRALAAWPGGCALVVTYILADWSPLAPAARGLDRAV